jgi:DNA-binding SARP family transcriptional activator
MVGTVEVNIDESGGNRTGQMSYPANERRDISAARKVDPKQLNFTLLGPIRAWYGHREVALGPPQQRAFLALLLLRIGKPVGKEEAVRALWGDAAPRFAEGTVRTYVYQLRRKAAEVAGLQRLALQSHSGGYLLTANGALVDADRLRQSIRESRTARARGDLRGAVELLRESLTLWHGTPFAGINTTYFNIERERLEQVRATAVEDLAEAEIVAGLKTDAVVTLRAALAEHPLRENLWELLLTALSDLGRRAEALAAYQEARRVLRAELGFDPESRLQELHRSILTEARKRTVAGASTPIHRPNALGGFSGRAAELPELTLADALQLLGSIVGHDRLHQDIETSARLVAACSYQPDAVRALAERLLTAPYRTLREVEGEVLQHA